MSNIDSTTPRSFLTLPRMSDVKTRRHNGTIHNMISVHNFEERHWSLDIDFKGSSITTNQYEKGDYKTFMFDAVSRDNETSEDAIMSAIEEAINWKDSIVLSVSRGLQKKSQTINRRIIKPLIFSLLKYIESRTNYEDTKYSVQLSGVEINEEMDTMTKLGSTEDENTEMITLDDQQHHRCYDLEMVSVIIDKLHSKASSNDKFKRQYIYTVQVNKYSGRCTVPIKCSRIFLILMDLTKLRDNNHCLSPRQFANFLTSSVYQNNQYFDDKNNFQNIIFDLFRRYSINLFVLTHVSSKDSHLNDTYQLLQMANKIQRLKIKNQNTRKSKNSKHLHRPDHKYSDTEVTSTSEISCAETVVCREDHALRVSDDDSRRYRPSFESSDSDSGYKDLKSRNAPSKCTGLMMAAWRRSAIKMAKRPILNGEELWVDGPQAVQENESKWSPCPASLTIDQAKSKSEKIKPPMSSHEGYGCLAGPDRNWNNEGNIHTLTNINEVIEGMDTLRSTKNCHNTNLSVEFEYTTLQRNDVRNLSNWINDVNELALSQESDCKSVRENNILNQSFAESSYNQCYEYCDPRIQSIRNPSPIQYTNDHVCNNNSFRCYNVTPDSDRKVFAQPTDRKTKRFHKKKDHNDLREPNIKSKPFSPLEILKRALMKKKSKDITDDTTLAPCCSHLSYTTPLVKSTEYNYESTSSDSECNEWFRNVKTFKSKEEYSMQRCSSPRPPSAPLLISSNAALRSKCSSRQRSNSSGYSSVIVREDGELSSRNDSTSDQSIQKSISLSFASHYQPVPEDFDPYVMSERCEALVKQETAILYIQQQEMMIKDFNTSTRPLLTRDNSKYLLKASIFDSHRAATSSQYLEELEEDTNIVRDSIAFYKSLVHLESSFVT